MKVRHLFVDYDNTLHDSDAKFIRHFHRPALALGLTGQQLWRLYLFEVHRGIVHRYHPERHDDKEFHCLLIFQRLGRPYDRGTASLLVSAFEKAMEECWRDPTFFPDAFPFLEEASRRWELHLATSENALQKALCVERVGGRRYFSSVLGDHNVGVRKTEKEYYLRALELTGARPEESVMVGDSLTHDILPARRAGLGTVWVNRKGERPEGEVGPEARDLREVLEFLRDP